MVEENISKVCRLKKTDKTRNYFLEEIQKSESMIRNHKKVCKTLNYIELY